MRSTRALPSGSPWLPKVAIMTRPEVGHVEHRKAMTMSSRTEIHLYMTFDAEMDPDSATRLAEHFKDLVFNDAYQTMQLPISVVTAFTEYQ